MTKRIDKPIVQALPTTTTTAAAVARSNTNINFLYSTTTTLLYSTLPDPVSIYSKSISRAKISTKNNFTQPKST